MQYCTDFLLCQKGIRVITGPLYDRMHISYLHTDSSKYIVRWMVTVGVFMIASGLIVHALIGR